METSFKTLVSKNEAKWRLHRVKVKFKLKMQFPVIIQNKKHSFKQVVSIINLLGKDFWKLLLLKVCETLIVYFDLYQSSQHFLRRENQKILFIGTNLRLEFRSSFKMKMELSNEISLFLPIKTWTGFIADVIWMIEMYQMSATSLRCFVSGTAQFCIHPYYTFIHPYLFIYQALC